MSEKIIYSMIGVGKIVPPNKQILRDISLSYFLRRQDRRVGAKWGRQEHPTTDHGRR